MKVKNLFEVAIGAVLALAFFLVLLGLMNLIFPGATPIGALARDRGGEGRRAGAVDLDGLGGRVGIATLLEVDRAVRDKPSGSVVWSDSGEGTPLDDHHAVQTLRGSSAAIEFDDANRVDLGPDSLIVVRRPNRLQREWERRAAVEFVGGTLSGALAEGDGRRQVELQANGRTIRAARGSERTARFDLREAADGRTVLAVRGGDAEMTDGDGVVRIPADHMVRFDEQTVDRARPLPIPPEPVRPAPGSRFVFRESPPIVEFAWRARSQTREHRLRIERVAGNGELEPVFESDLGASAFEHGNLRAGTYRWEVSAVVDGAPGDPAAAGRFEVVRDVEPPPLSIERVETTGGGSLLLAGSTEPGAALFVGERAVAVDAEGRFDERLPLRDGVNFVVIQAVDPAGNTTFVSREVSTGSVVGRRSR